MKPTRLRAYRIALAFFILGLVASGGTAFPLLHELRLLAAWLGIDDPSVWRELSGVRHWIAFVWLVLEHNHAQFPFIAYGTDWLAFGHLCLALFFLRPLWKPLESDWVLKCGLICCAGVIPLALVAGTIRGIPFYWRLIDCSFGVIGAMPLLYCLHLVHATRASTATSVSPSVTNSNSTLGRTP
jgi:hypothetical protein